MMEDETAQITIVDESSASSPLRDVKGVVPTIVDEEIILSWLEEVEAPISLPSSIRSLSVSFTIDDEIVTIAVSDEGNRIDGPPPSQGWIRPSTIDVEDAFSNPPPQILEEATFFASPPLSPSTVPSVVVDVEWVPQPVPPVPPAPTPSGVPTGGFGVCLPPSPSSRPLRPTPLPTLEWLLEPEAQPQKPKERNQEEIIDSILQFVDAESKNSPKATVDELFAKIDIKDVDAETRFKILLEARDRYMKIIADRLNALIEEFNAFKAKKPEIIKTNRIVPNPNEKHRVGGFPTFVAGIFATVLLVGDRSIQATKKRRRKRR